MIVVVGEVTAREGAEAAVEAVSLEHVRRSRAEPGCISHEVSRDLEQPRRFVFVERWSDLAALQAHFGLAASRQFAQALGELAEARPRMAVYRAETVSPA